MARHELRKDRALGDHVVRCVVCQQQWDMETIGPGTAGALQFQECPGEPFRVHDEVQVSDTRQFQGDIEAMMKPGFIQGSLTDFSDFKPEHGEVPTDYVSPAQQRKRRIRELFAELGELLAEDGA